MNKSRAAVSVIIPCYRCASTIRRAVASIDNQSEKPIEIILIDDASGDDTLDTLKSLKNEFGDWVKIIELSKNVGAGVARNIGWAIATQPYIAFLDSDDGWHVNKIEIQYGYMRGNPNVVLSGHSYRQLSKDVFFFSWTIELKSVSIVTWWKLLLKNQFVTPSVMIKKDIDFRFGKDSRYMEDHLLWLEVIGSNQLAVRLNVELAAVFKPMYGSSGLSSNLWLMEKSELSNYKYLYINKSIGLFQYYFLQIFSISKFIKRLFVVHIVRNFL